MSSPNIIPAVSASKERAKKPKDTSGFDAVEKALSGRLCSLQTSRAKTASALISTFSDSIDTEKELSARRASTNGHTLWTQHESVFDLENHCLTCRTIILPPQPQKHHEEPIRRGASIPVKFRRWSLPISLSPLWVFLLVSLEAKNSDRELNWRSTRKSQNYLKTRLIYDILLDEG